MSQRRITLGDVAREAGVSMGTASDALSGRGRMTEATRSTVRETAMRLGYRANILARGLRTGRTHTIGLHLLNAADSFEIEYFRELVAGVLDVAVRHDYDLNLLSSDPDRRRLAAAQVDGIIIPDPIATDVRAIELLHSHVPVVAGERFPPGMPVAPVIGVDHETALAELLDHAHAHGSRRPVLFAADEQSGWGVVLRDAFVRWCDAHPDVEGRFRTTDFEWNRFLAGGGESLGSLLRSPEPVDLVIVPGEHAALKAMEMIRDAGLEVGRQVMVAACADAHVLEICDPTVSAIDLSPRSLGSACADALVAHLDHGAPLPGGTLMPARLVLRGSTTGSARPDAH